MRGILPALLLSGLAPALAALPAPDETPPPARPAARGAADPATGAGPAPTVTVVPLGPETARHMLRDMDGDGDLDLVRVDPEGVSVHRMRDDRTWPEEPEGSRSWPEGHLGWTLADVDGDGVAEVALLVGGREVRVWRLAADGTLDGGGGVLLSDDAAVLPRGIRHVPFVQDVDADEAPDLVLPSRGRYRIHRALPGAGYAPPVEVAFEARVTIDVGDPGGLHGRFAEDVTIPWFRLEDVDGDGTVDLVSETEDTVLFHLARPELQTEPSWRLDKAALRDELPDRPIDLDDLFGNFGDRVTWRIEEVDGTPPRDLVLQQAGTFRVWNGGAAGDIERPPDKLLKSSGNVLYYVLRDVLGDDLPELQIIRAESVSLGQVVRWLVVPGALHFDVFTYLNTDGVFGRKPAKRSRVTLEIPRLLAFIEELEAMEDELEARFETPARRLDLDGDGLAGDVVDLVEGRLVVHRDVVPDTFEEGLRESIEDTSLDGLLEAFILRDLDALEDGRSKTIDLGDVRELDLSSGWALRQLCAGRDADLEIPTVYGDGGQADLRVVDLDGDGRLDVVAVGETSEARHMATLVVMP